MNDPVSSPPRRRPADLVRSFVLADFITLGNAASGTAAMFFCLDYIDLGDSRRLWAAMALMPLAFICDAADGMVARWRHRSSPYGADLDSLADIVSFGVAPAVIGYTVGLRGAWDVAILLYFVCCGIGRLARFNVTAADLMTEKGKVAYFEGTPIPVSLLLVGVLAFAFSRGEIGANLWGGDWILLGGRLHAMAVLYLLTGSLMISTIRIPKP